jgi:hypothetical protein
LKTIEVYDTIFQVIDEQQLQRDLVLYSYGLFPLLSVAALPVKPVLLALYETYYLPLGNGLQSIATGFIIGLLSSLDTDVDSFNRIIVLLECLSKTIDTSYFYTCIWSAIQLVASVRHSAIVFLCNHFNQISFINGLSIETMVNKLISTHRVS